MNFRNSGIQIYLKAIQKYKENKDLQYALKIQNQYAKVILKNLEKWNFQLKENFIVAGIDVTFIQEYSIAGIVLLDHNLKILEKNYKITKINFPYISGFLSFRELEPIILLIKEMKIEPDLFCFDGQGIAHPRFLGIASHGGILFNIPSIGIAKSKLVGNFDEKELFQNKKAKLFYKNYFIGWSILTGKKSPIFVSPGWKVGIYNIPEIISKITKFKIPEPTRLAHFFVKEIRNKVLNKEFNRIE